MVPRKRIITPREALSTPHMRIRPRNAPPVTPGATVRGWVDWRLVDRRGREVAGGQSPNMWLDQGLDAIATSTATAGMFGTSILAAQYAAVGTGSTAPASTQTALDAEGGRTSTTYDSSTRTRTANGVYEFKRYFEFNYAVGNGNLTEWGVATSSSDGLLTRALFLDDLGDPITITKTSDYKLRLAYTCEVALSPVILTSGSIVVDGLGTLNGDFAWQQSSAVGDGDITTFSRIARGAPLAVTLDTSTSWAYSGANFYPGPTGRGTATSSAYSGGTYERTFDAQWGTSQGNLANIRKIVVGFLSGPNFFHGASFLTDEADAFTKDDLNVLNLDTVFTVTWARG